MTNKTKLFAALAVAFASQAAVAGVDFNGYLRSGSGTSSENGVVTCFRLNGAGPEGAPALVGGAGRLGNECDTYGELAFGTQMGEAEGTKFGIRTLLAFGAQQNTDYEQTVPAFREAYGTATGFGKGALAKSTVWAGKRYYNRKDVHIVDYFWLEVAGPGAGIENVDLGFGKFSYALMRTGTSKFENLGTVNTQTIGRATFIDKTGDQKVNHDFRLEGINLGKAGSLGFGVNLIRSNNSDAEKGMNLNGWSGWASQSMVIGAVQNSVTFRMARDSGTLNGNGWWWSSATNGNDHKAWSLIDSANFEFGDHWNGQAYVSYTVETVPGWGLKDGKTFSAVVRPVYHFNDLYSVAFELGRAQTKNAWTGNETNSLNKFTIAPQLSMGSGFFARPVLRAYYTHASWNKKGAASACTGRDCAVSVDGFANATSGNSLGVQMEAWW
jgi:maltoporin